MCAHMGGQVGKNPYCLKCLRERFIKYIDPQGSMYKCDDEVHDQYGECETLVDMKLVEE